MTRSAQYLVRRSKEMAVVIERKVFSGVALVRGEEEEVENQ